MSTGAGKMMVWALVAWAVCAPGAGGETRFVSPLGMHVAPFANWADAATNIQSAIDVCGTGDVVLVTNGAYALGATVRVTNQVALVSLNGRDETVLDGSTLAAGQDGVPAPAAGADEHEPKDFSNVRSDVTPLRM